MTVFDRNVLAQLTNFVGPDAGKRVFSEFLVRDIRSHSVSFEKKLNEMDAMATFLDSGFSSPFEANGHAAVDTFVLNAITESNRKNGSPSARTNLLAQHLDRISIPSSPNAYLCTHPVACDESSHAVLETTDGNMPALEAAVAIGFTYCLEHNQTCTTYDNVHSLVLFGLFFVPMYTGTVWRSLRALGKTIIGKTPTGEVEVPSASGPTPTATPGTRLTQDINIQASHPTPPLAAENFAGVGRASHQAYLRNLLASLRATHGFNNVLDVRVNQQMVNFNLERVGINRPDLQYTLNGVRYYVEVEGLGNPRGAAHRTRILANDPAGSVTVTTIP